MEKRKESEKSKAKRSVSVEALKGLYHTTSLQSLYRSGKLHCQKKWLMNLTPSVASGEKEGKGEGEGQYNMILRSPPLTPPPSNARLNGDKRRGKNDAQALGVT
jgi:hypothetical protein